jgi:hypothetical protein
MKTMKRAWMVLAAVALGCGAPPSKQGLHDACASDRQCAQGQACLQYTGFSGQPLSTCEIPCTSARDCPAPLECLVVADGPGQLTCN